MIADFVVMTRGNKAALLQAKEQAFDYLEFPRGRTIADGYEVPSLTRGPSRAGSVLTYQQRSLEIEPMMTRSDLKLDCDMLTKQLLLSVPQKPDAVRDVLTSAIKKAARDLASGSRQGTYDKYLALLQSDTVWVLPRTAQSEPTIAKALVADEPITLNRLLADAKGQGYTEIYHVYRYRADSRLGPDRLPEATLHARNIDEAVKKLIAIAGYDEAEAELLGLDQFDASTILDLCDRLKELTGDTYSVSPYEMPHEP